MKLLRLISLLALIQLANFSVLANTALAAPQPDVNIGVDSPSLLGEPVNIALSFSNSSVTPSDTGYFPMIEVVLPQGLECAGGCPGLSVVTPMGAPTDFVVFGGDGIAGATYTNPITGESITIGNDETLIIINAPVGTIAVGQPALEFNIPATMTSDAAVGVGMNVEARGIFALGDSANGSRGACGSGADTICQTVQTEVVTPSALKFEKIVGNSLALPTGPNYPRQFEIFADIGTGVTPTNIQISDTIPDELVITGPAIAADCSGNPAFTINPVPTSCSFTYDPNGGGSFTVSWSSLVGGPGNEIQIQYEAYVQQLVDGSGASIIDPNSGAPTTSQNAATLNYTLGTPQPVLNSQVTIEQKSLDIQKSNSVSDALPAGESPGDTITWQIVLYVSDYFSLNDLDFDDDIRDGQTYVPNSFSVEYFEGVDTAVLNGARTDESIFIPYLSVNPEVDGETHIDFNISAALAAPLVFNRDRVLVGNSGGVGAPTRVVISYQTTIDEQFESVLGLGDTTIIDAGDTIVNDSSASAVVDGQVIPIPVSSTSSVAIPPLTAAAVGKVAEFKNGGAPGNPVLIAFQDEITYKITVQVPTGDVEDFFITDLLPTPLFSSTDPDADGTNEAFVQDAQGDTAPPAGHWKFTSASFVPGGVVTVAQNGDDNSLKFDFDDHLEDGAGSNARTIEILFTVTATNAPVADDLKLVNLLGVSHANSETEASTTLLSAVAALITESPKLSIQKSANAIVSGNGSISGDNFNNVDADDELRFLIRLSNTGAETAFDVRAEDVLPTGLQAPTGGWTIGGNVTISDGGGANTCNTASFSLDGTAPANTFRIINGEIDADAVCDILFTAVVSPETELDDTLTNTATTTYTKQVGGPTYSPEQDQTTISLRDPSIAKNYALGSSSDTGTTDTNLRAGETVTFNLSVTVPAGKIDSFILQEQDTASGNPAGDFFENITTADVSFPAAVENNCINGNMALFNFVGDTEVCFTKAPTLPANQSQASATSYQIDFGTLYNFETDDISAHTITVGVVTKVKGGKATGTYTNRAVLAWGGGPTTGTATFVLVAPALTLSKTLLSAGPLFEIGDNLSYRVDVTNTGSSKAYNITDLEDTLPTGLGSASLTLSQYQGTGVGSLLSQVGQLVSIDVLDTSPANNILNGEVFRAEYQVTVQGTQVSDSTAGPGHPAAPGGVPDGSLVDGPGCVNSLANSVDIDQFETGAGGTGATITSVATSSATANLDSDGDGIPNSVETVTTSCPDSDLDGIPDHLDTDADDNGIPDSTEYGGGADADGDGVPDYRDTDDDDDGRSDWDEIQDVGGNPTTDSDGDGAPDYLDPDSDNDGIGDGVETTTDTDGDGLPNRLDPDSDDDGIPDWYEAGNAEPVGTDMDSDGIDDAFDTDEGGAGLNPTPSNVDGDSKPDYLELDSDDDGLSDYFEAGNPDPTGTDIDGDGIDNSYDPDQGGAGLNGTPDNRDGDPTPDFREVDSDADGISDQIEADTPVAAGADTDSDGIDNAYDTDQGGPGLDDSDTDTDGEGTPDRLDLDSDNDGIPDSLEGTTDTDSDGVPDFRDLDSDNDGTPDYIEAGNPAPTGADTDNDGIDDAFDIDQGGPGLNATPTNTDGDGTPDFREVDADNDLIDDRFENGLPAATNTDTDGDGIDDAYDTDQGGAGLDATPIDTDGDGTPDYQDIDSDDDGISDASEGNISVDGDTVPNYLDPDSDNDGLSDWLEADNAQPVGTDTDNDGIDDAFDTDQGGAGLNPTPTNTDGDIVTDFLDLDSDNDGLSDYYEAGNPNPSGTDTDGDGIDNAYDTDQGGAGLNNNPDNRDGDATPDFREIDSDDDGINDQVEADTLPLDGADADGDGIDDAYDTNQGGPGLDDSDTDTDGDGTPDRHDLDSDNDGIPDSLEDTTDTDSDGVPDFRDVDSDNDGTPDYVEAGNPAATGTDTDNDGIDNAYDTDQGGAGLNATPTNTDGDGTPDFREVDADNDGINDSVENGLPASSGNDTDGDGIDDAYDTDQGGGGLDATPIDTDSDGTPDYQDLDADNDGIADSSEGNTDTDGDGLPNYLDPDSDDDGIPDWYEADNAEPVGTDTDNDGIDNAFDTDQGGAGLNTTPTNTDGDSRPDYLELDSDNDGLSDYYEAGNPDPSGTDTDGDGIDDSYDIDQSGAGLNATPDNRDGDSTPDFREVDSDADGINDQIEADTPVAAGADTDSDGIDNAYDTDQGGPGLDNSDTDTDGDGTPDRLDLDSDNDGLADSLEGTTDTDSDGVPDFRDVDSDNDGTPDYIEAGNPTPTGTDADNDGIDDAFDTDQGGPGLNATPTDTDGDTTPDFREIDADDDGIDDSVENGLPAPSGNDTDGDGIDDAYDTNQGGAGLDTTPIDFDGDGTPDYQDLDADNDGIADLVETDTDSDGDGLLNFMDIDADNDGLPDYLEDRNVVATGNDTDGDGIDDAYDPDQGGVGLNISPPDTDNDTISNYLDIDSDDDGIPDNVEAQTTAGFTLLSGNDANANGLDDAFDALAGGSSITPVNSFGMDAPDYLDSDSDDDGIPDSTEGHDNNHDGIPDAIPVGTDADGDGLDDSFDIYDLTMPPPVGDNPTGSNAPLQDTDGTEDRDWRDIDDDGDGIDTADELTTDTNGNGSPDYLDADKDGDGIPDNTECPMGAPCPDSDGDGVSNDLDLDSDNDGVIDQDEDESDFDGDGIANYLDLDSDGDGIVDLIEAGGVDSNGDGLLDTAGDTDGDGLFDLVDPDNGGTPLSNGDFDGDGTSNALDIDSDGDGIVDLVEAQSELGTLVPSGLDSDVDGIDDTFDLDAGGTPLTPFNTDSTDTPDYLDLDTDNDGIDDSLEGHDADFDGQPDNVPSGNDSDGDGLDDSFDVDVGPVSDSNAPLQNFDGTDSRDWRDTDDDNDGIDTVVEGPVDTDEDGTPDRYDLDSDDDGIPDQTEGSGDLDGDGIPDFQTPRFSLKSPFYFIWNGFLRQANVAVLYNKSATQTADVTVTLLSIDGAVLSTQNLQLDPHEEFDFLVNGMPGFALDTYGLVKIEFTPAGTIDGYTGLYRIGEDGEEVEFALLKEHQNSQRGTSYAVFNTYQPSIKPGEEDNVVIHWLQLANHNTTEWKAFTVNRYSEGGSIIDTRRVSIPPQGRRDVQAGHEDSVYDRVGLVEVVPDDPTSNYGGELFRYGGDSVRNIFPSTYSFGIADKLDIGETKPQFVSVSRGANGFSFLELTNLNTVTDTVRVEVYSNFGTLLLNTFVTLDQREQIHLDMQSALAEGEVGYAKISSALESEILVRSSTYYYEPDGRVATAYSSSGRKPLLDFGFSSFNVFFDQQNWLKLFNSGTLSTDITVEAYRADGSLLGSQNLTVGANSGVDVELRNSFGFDLGTDTYGKFKVTSTRRNVLASDIVRIKPSADEEYVDLAKILPVR